MQIQNATEKTAVYFNEIINSIANFLGLSQELGGWVHQLLGLSLLLGAAFVSWLLALFILRFKVARLVRFSKGTWDDTMQEKGVFRRVALLVPGLVLYFGKNAFLLENSQIFILVHTLSIIYSLIILFTIAQASLSAIETIYKSTRFAKKAPITGFIQVGRLLVSLALIFLLISLLLGKSPVYLLSGLTAIAAVLLLVFKDAILGFVAGIQIAANRMFNTGDWIQMPKFDVDGEILEIGLTIVKVQNWDKTISTLPSYSLTTEAIKNWRGMTESGGRRIKRAINIDLKSLEFASADDLLKWQKLEILQPYLKSKTLMLDEEQKVLTEKQIDFINARKLTNIGTFRAYIKEYLARHPDVNQNMTCMVRQLPPKEVGLPLEVYCFSKNQNWVEYEGIQADIFDHILSIMPYFNLRTYQRITNTENEFAMSAKQPRTN